ncbi:hypothetical protein [Hymenobacter cellulosilyticus]|uniref:Uncharacterized protein n=1 Tax=Hymenobacter cellulosilyticus TaxID=2932248 RepID=A0A8T9Q415_9BACT|nr:hypothetical protein [Hymenobacter cellulosilyticus]UOQ72314.1 hypothetical protein MUN79_27850 [Hymenobacter cellulosilyticus]
MKTSTRLFLLLTLVLAQVSALASTIHTSLGQHRPAYPIQQAPSRPGEGAQAVTLSVYPNPSRGW